ncbi:hypothetical protein BXY51_005773 [Actinoplanes cyaneus]|nr:hypothetical protein [Actinoplanes cyaneus]
MRRRGPAIRTLFGAPMGLDTAGGFTVWRVGTFTAVLLGAGVILATTRITRGEEDTGRWDVLLAGRVPLREAVARHVTTVMIGRPRPRGSGGGRPCGRAGQQLRRQCR